MPRKCAVPGRRASVWFAGVCLMLGSSFGVERSGVVHAASPEEGQAGGLERTESVANSWQASAAVEDWPAVAQGIDAMAERARSEPETRYVRAVAALRLGNSERALAELQGLAEQLPELREQIAALEAECQLEHGPFEAAASYYAAQSSPSYWLRAAQAWQRAGRVKEALGRSSACFARARIERGRSARGRCERSSPSERGCCRWRAKSTVGWPWRRYSPAQTKRIDV